MENFKDLNEEQKNAVKERVNAWTKNHNDRVSRCANQIFNEYRDAVKGFWGDGGTFPSTDMLEAELKRIYKKYGISV